MLAIYVASSGPVGKTTLCAGLGDELLRRGKKPGFFKPVPGSDAAARAEAEKDALFLKQVLKLDEEIGTLCPSLPLPASGKGEAAEHLKRAYAAASKGKDVMLIEGVSGLAPDLVAETLGARVVQVLPYSFTSLQNSVSAAISSSGRLLTGLVVNMVPASKLQQTKQAIAPLAKKAALKSLSLLPEERLLFAPTIGDMANLLGGKVVNNEEALGGVAEHIMVGAMNPDPGPIYFSRKENKAVIARKERPDMQMAALQTSVRGLVVSRGGAPIPQVLQEAQRKGVPIVTVEQDTLGVMEAIEKALKTGRFRQLHRMGVLRGILQQHLDFSGLLEEPAA